MTGCPECEAYLARRARVVTVAVVLEAAARNIRPRPLFTAYMGAIHTRHQAGLPLTTEVPA